MDADISGRQSERFRIPLHGARVFNDLTNVRGDNARQRADGPGSINRLRCSAPAERHLIQRTLYPARMQGGTRNDDRMNTTTTELPAGIKTVAIGIGDLNGNMRGKRVTAENWKRAKESGVAASIAVFACDTVSDVWDNPYVNMDNGYTGMHLFPASPVRAVPWEYGCAFRRGLRRPDLRGNRTVDRTASPKTGKWHQFPDRQP